MESPGFFCRDFIPFSDCSNNKCQCLLGFKLNQPQTKCVQKSIGEKCELDFDCEVFLTNSVCEKGSCQCSRGFQFHSTTEDCREIYLGAQCSSSDYCFYHIQNSFCYSNECVCLPTFRSFHGNSCQATPLLELTCNSTSECLEISNFSFCSQTNFCLCNIGFNTEASSFQRSCGKIMVGDSCQSSEDCLVFNEESHCDVHKRCACNSGFGFSEFFKKCVDWRIGDDGCSLDKECQASIPFSVCNLSKCICKTSFKSSQDGKLCKRITIGDKCESDEFCNKSVISSHCRLGICKCFIGFFFDKKFFTSPEETHECKIMTLGSRGCTSDKDCKVNTKNSFCNLDVLGSTCLCLKGYYGFPIENSRECLPRKIKEGYCSESDQCRETLNNTICSPGNHCICLKGFKEVEEAGNLKCKARSLYDDSICFENEDCTPTIPGSHCLHGSCRCLINHIEENKTTCRPRKVSDNCSSDEDCQPINYAFCSQDRSCDCRAGYTANQEMSKCLLMKIGNVGCKEDSDCFTIINNTICKNESCACGLGFENFGDSECTRISVGSNCSEDKDCSVSINKSFCFNFTCKCETGFAKDHFGSHCNLLRVGEGECVESRECSKVIQFSSCINSSCQCYSGYAAANNGSECVRRKLGDSTCLVKADCSDAIRHGNCSGDHCVCEYGYIESSSNPYQCLRRKLGDNSPCQEDLDCNSTIFNSLCLNMECVCHFGYVPSIDNFVCVARKLGDNCNLEADCTSVINFSHCDNDSFSCECLSGFAQISTRVCKKRKIGDTNCLVDSDCRDAVPFSECFWLNFNYNNLQNSTSSLNLTSEGSKKQHVCKCHFGYYSNSNGSECIKRKIGDECREDFDCSYAVLHSQCDSNTSTCVCDYDHLVILPDYTKCVDRPMIEQYDPSSVLKEFRMMLGCGRISFYHKYMQQCPRARPCSDGWTYREIYNGSSCFRAFAYILRMNLSQIAGKYELVPMVFNKTFEYNKTSDLYWENNFRLGFYGVDRIFIDSRNHLMNNSKNEAEKRKLFFMKENFLMSRVLEFRRTRGGIQVDVAFFLKYNKKDSDFMKSLSQNLISFILEANQGEVGLSKIFVKKPYKENFNLEDYDECKIEYPVEKDLKGRRNYCDVNALCTNLPGVSKSTPSHLYFIQILFIN